MAIHVSSVTRALCEQYEQLLAGRRADGRPCTTDELLLRAHLAIGGRHEHVVADVLADPSLPPGDATRLLSQAQKAFAHGDGTTRLRLVTLYAARPENAHRIGSVLPMSNMKLVKRAWEDKQTPPVVRSWLANNLPLTFLAYNGHPRDLPFADEVTILRRFAHADPARDVDPGGEPVDGASLFERLATSWSASGRRLDRGDGDYPTDAHEFATAVTAAIDLTLDHPHVFAPYLFTNLIPYACAAHRSRLAERTFARFADTVPTRQTITAVTAALPPHRDGDYAAWVQSVTDPKVAQFATTSAPARVQRRVTLTCREVLSDTSSELAALLLDGIGTAPHLWDLAAALIADSDIEPRELAAALAGATNAASCDPVTLPATT